MTLLEKVFLVGLREDVTIPVLVISMQVTPLYPKVNTGRNHKHGFHHFRDLSYGKGSTSPLRNAELPKIEEREPWDGKDAEVRIVCWYIFGTGDMW